MMMMISNVKSFSNKMRVCSTEWKIWRSSGVPSKTRKKKEKKKTLGKEQDECKAENSPSLCLGTSRTGNSRLSLNPFLVFASIVTRYSLSRFKFSSFIMNGWFFKSSLSVESSVFLLAPLSVIWTRYPSTIPRADLADSGWKHRSISKIFFVATLVNHENRSQVKLFSQIWFHPGPTCSEKCNQDFTSPSKSGIGNKVTIKPGQTTNTAPRPWTWTD